MIILNCNGISLSFGTNVILENISFNLQNSEKAGIIGINGAGKSTLFRILSGILPPDSGEIFMAKGRKLGYLEQNTGLDSSNTILDELMSIYSHFVEMEARTKSLEAKISVEKDETLLSSYMKEYSNVTEKFASTGGYEYNSRVRGVLKGLGFNEDQFALKIQTLSGGQKTRLALAKLLLEEPDILLLDEPTNHLDIDALEWLEDFLKSYKNCALIISHDRYFLDSVTTKTIELEGRNSKTYNGNYSLYVKQKAADREIQQKHFEVQQKEISRMEAFIDQQRQWNREKNIVAAESRMKAIDRMEKVDKPKVLPDKVKMKFKTGIISGNDVLFIEELCKEYPGKQLFKNVSFKLRKNENVFLLGPNGCGKSTLLKIITGKLQQNSGDYSYGHNVKVGYYDQEHEDIDDSNTIIEEVWDSNEKLTHTEIRNALASFLFKGDDVFKSVSVLSGGEKSRVALVKLMLSPSNLLILDEPTNHLDINSREVLEDALQRFEGTILAVSHDRYFIKKLSTRILELGSNAIFDYQHDYTYYLEHRDKIRKDAQAETQETKVSASKLERMSSKEEKARQRKIEKQLSETEKEIGQSETRLSEIARNMEKEEVFTDHLKLTDLHNEQDMLNKKLEELYELWETLEEQKAEMECS